MPMGGGDDVNRMDVQSKVEEVKGIMQQNVRQVAQPAKSPSVVPGAVSAHPDDLIADQAAGRFASHGSQVRRRLACNNKKMWALIAGGVVAAALTIFLIACFAGGQSCVTKHSAPAVSDGPGEGSREPHHVNTVTYLGVPQGDSALSPGEPIDVAAESAAAAAAPAAEPAADPAAAEAAEPAVAAEPAAAAAELPPAASKEPHFVNNITYLGVPEGDSALSPGAPTTAAPTAGGRRLRWRLMLL